MKDTDLKKKHSFPQGESLSCEAEDLGKTWQSFVAENALRARDGEQVANFDPMTTAFLATSIDKNDPDALQSSLSTLSQTSDSS